MHSWAKMTLITTVSAGWLLLGGCLQRPVASREAKPTHTHLRTDSLATTSHPATESAEDAHAEAQLGDVKYLARLSAGGSLSRDFVRRWGKPEMIPELLVMLKDPTFADNWGGIAQLLALADPDPRSLPAIIDFITRQDDWRDLPQRTLNIRVGAKIHAARWIGWIGGPEATAFLRRVVGSRDGAESALLWFRNERSPEIHGGSRDTTRVIFANAAAVGLVYTRDPENIAIVRDRFERCGAFRQAMVVNRIIEERGMDWYRRNYAGSEYNTLLSMYLRETYMEKPQPRLGRYSTEAKAEAETAQHEIR